MKIVNCFCKIVVVLCAAMLLWACSTNEVMKTTTIEVENISVSGQSSLSVPVGTTQVLTVVITPSDATNQAVTWSSSNTNVATVSGTGKSATVSAVSSGTTTITATVSNGKTVAWIITIPQENTNVDVQNISINKTSLSLVQGTTDNLTATVTPSNATNQTVVWSSSNPNVATVSTSGLVSAVSVGSVVITATAGGKSATCNVVVTEKTISVETVTINKPSISLEEGKKDTLSVVISPENATNKTVTWKSDNTQIAVVDANGIVEAKGSGSTTITATVDGKTATCNVIVVPVVQTTLNLTLDKSAMSIIAGEKETLTATVTASDGKSHAVTWSSADESIATVDEFGNVTAVAVGTTEITATCEGKTATCNVIVVPAAQVALTLVLDKSTISLIVAEEGDESWETLTATVTASDGKSHAVTWSSADESIATVDEHGTVTAVAVGTTEIIATCEDKTAKCTVSVAASYVAVTNVTVSPATATMTIGDIITLTYTISPTDATLQEVTWMSEKPNVATVNANGEVTAIAEGSVRIIATVEEKTAECVITIQKPHVPVTNISLDKNSITITEGGTEQLTATISPSDATNQIVSWTSDQPSVATVDSDGKILAVSAGTATITASAEGVTATCTVIVNAQQGTTIEGLDEKFLQFLINKGYDVDGNGKISTDEVENLTELDCSTQLISSLNGIDKFKSLKKLNCSNNQITSLDVSQNTSLTELNCRNNNVTALDVSMLPSLTTLTCDENNISSLDVSSNTSLLSLSCSSNPLNGVLNVVNNISLTSLTCSNTGLTSLDISNNTELTSLLCGNNNFSGGLDLSHNSKLNDLSCNNCRLTSLDLTNNVKLWNLDCSNNSLTVLDVSHTSMSTLLCNNNNLATLDLSMFDITMLDCSSNPLGEVLVKAGSDKSKWIKDAGTTFVEK